MTTEKQNDLTPTSHPALASASGSDASSEMLDSLSRNVTALALAIDPQATHGPETEKLVKYESEIREKLFGLLCGLYDDAICQDDKGTRAWVLPLVEMLGWRERIRERLWPKPSYPTASERRQNDQAEASARSRKEK